MANYGQHYFQKLFSIDFPNPYRDLGQLIKSFRGGGGNLKIEQETCPQFKTLDPGFNFLNLSLKLPLS